MPLTLTQTSPRLGRLAALTVAVALAVVTVGGAPARAVSVADGPIEIILEKTNSHRASKGKSALRLNASAINVAQNWSDSMLSKRSLAHNPSYSSQMPSGWTRVGENVGYACGYGSPASAAQAIMNAWLKSAGHEANIRGDFTDIGIGFAYSSSSDCAYSTQDFGKYSGSNTSSAIVGSIAPPSGKSMSSLSNVTVVASGGGVTRTAAVSPLTGEYVLTGLPKGKFTVRMKSSTSGITSEYLSDAASTRCATRVSVSSSDKTDLDAKLTSGTLQGPASSVELCDVTTNKDSIYYASGAASIGWVVDSGIATGYSNGLGAYEFRPKSAISRGSMAGFLYRLAGSPSFSAPSTSPFVDVPTSAKSYKAIAWLYANGIVDGYDAGGGKLAFNPSSKISRGSTASMLYKLGGEPKFSAPSSSPFRDVSTGARSYKAIVWLYNSDVVSGYGSGSSLEFKPASNTSRGSMAGIVHRYDSTF